MVDTMLEIKLLILSMKIKQDEYFKTIFISTSKKRCIYSFFFFLFLFSTLAHKISNINFTIDLSLGWVFWAALLIKIILCVFLVVFFVLTLLMLRVIYRVFFVKQYIEVSSTSIKSPISMIGKDVEINVKDIDEIHMENIAGQLSIVINHTRGRLIISEILLQDREVFFNLVSSINEAKGVPPQKPSD